MVPDDRAKAQLSQGDRAAIDPPPAARVGVRGGTLTNVDARDIGISRGPSASSLTGDGPNGDRDSGLADLARDAEIESGWVIETVISPFQCLYQDALSFHTQSRLARSESDAGRLARAALLLYVSSAEALVHQAAEELGRTELHSLLANAGRPLPLFEVWRLLPAIVAQNGIPTRPLDCDVPPWPQFAELLMLRTSWAYPGTAATRRTFYRSDRRDGEYEPLEVHQVPPDLARTASPGHLAYPLTGLPRDPYALRPRHVDTARGLLDAAIDALDSCMGGALTRGQRHRREPVRIVYPPPGRVEPFSCDLRGYRSNIVQAADVRHRDGA